uniref:Apt1 n=1 Tax=Arundo donax TaxID=35708 RepID=A0A0A9DD19_ARUDO
MSLLQAKIKIPPRQDWILLLLKRTLIALMLMQMYLVQTPLKNSEKRYINRHFSHTTKHVRNCQYQTDQVHVQVASNLDSR